MHHIDSWCPGRHSILPVLFSAAALRGSPQLSHYSWIGRQQCYLSKCKYLQPARPLDRFGIYGSVIHGPIVHLWLSSITRLLPGTTPFLVLVKVVTDQVPFFAFSKGVSSLCQVIFAPVISTCFFVGLALLEGRRTGLLDLWREKVLLDFLVSVLTRSPIKKF